MHISRRNFLQGISGSAGAVWSCGVTGLHKLAAQELACVVLDLKLGCALRESFEGYQAAFADEHVYLAADRLDSRWRCRTVIVPGLGTLDPATGRMLLDLAQEGARLVLESGSGFLSPAEITAHRRMLRRSFELETAPPVNLWLGKPADHGLLPHRKAIDGHQSIPYVRYVWPRETMVRDFTQVLPVSATRGEVIGWAGSLAVASKTSVGKGTLIFLGSPLGPALGAGDREARSWLQSVVVL